MKHLVVRSIQNHLRELPESPAELPPALMTTRLQSDPEFKLRPVGPGTPSIPRSENAPPSVVAPPPPQADDTLSPHQRSFDLLSNLSLFWTGDCSECE